MRINQALQLDFPFKHGIHEIDSFKMEGIRIDVRLMCWEMGGGLVFLPAME